MRMSGAKLGAIALLLAGNSASRVSDAVGVSRMTLYRWRQEPEFATVLRLRQEAVFLQATDRLRATLVSAVEEVEWALKSKDPRDRLRVAYRLLPYVGAPKLRPMAPAPIGEESSRKLK